MLKKSNERQFNSDWKCEGMEFHLVGRVWRNFDPHLLKTSMCKPTTVMPECGTQSQRAYKFQAKARWFWVQSGVQRNKKVKTEQID